MITVKSKILVVDDEPDIVAVLGDFLVKKGYEVVEAFSCEEALNILDRERLDLILLDLMMPGLNGTEAARIIKKKYPSIKIVILTGFPDMGESLLYENILDGAFTKPIRLHELFDRLLEILGHKEKQGLNSKTRQKIKERDFLITARLLFVESSLGVYDLLKEHFEQLSEKGEHYLLDVAGSEEQIMEKLSQFNPDILLVNASFLKNQGRDIILDVLAKNSQFKEALIYNIDDIKNIDKEKLDRLTKNVELTCSLRGYM